MTKKILPLETQFRLLANKQSDLWGLINAKIKAELALHSRPFEDAGYSIDELEVYIQTLKNKTIDELVSLALEDQADQSPSLIILQTLNSMVVIEKALQLCASKNSEDRVLGVNILMYQTDSQFRSIAVKTLIDLARMESDSAVLEVLAYALFQLDVADRSQYLQRAATCLVASTRKAAATSLSSLADNIAINLLITLSEDIEGDVRNWATFGLQPADKDLPNKEEIRDALFARVHDCHEEARHEALLGLAQYKDQRVIAPLIESITSEEVWELSVEAAKAIGSVQLYPYLLELQKWWKLDPELLNQAITACAPKTNGD